jgi:hypothetical protein
MKALCFFETSGKFYEIGEKEIYSGVKGKWGICVRAVCGE